MEKLREPEYPLPLEAYRDDFQEDVTKLRGQIRDIISKLNRLSKQGTISVPIQGLGLVREDLGTQIPRRKPQRIRER